MPYTGYVVDSFVGWQPLHEGLGKSSMGFTAEKAISFDFDRGAHRTGELRRGAVVQVQQWSDVANLTHSFVSSFLALLGL